MLLVAAVFLGGGAHRKQGRGVIGGMAAWLCKLGQERFQLPSALRGARARAAPAPAPAAPASPAVPVGAVPRHQRSRFGTIWGVEGCAGL